MKVWLNDSLESNLNLLPGDWLPGVGIFETLRAEGRTVFAFHRHYCRAADAANFLLPSEEQVKEALDQLLVVENYPVSRVRICFGSDGQWLITNHEYHDPKPAKLMIFESKNLDKKPKNKTFPYTRNISLHQDAEKLGYDDGVILSQENEVAETSYANIILEIDGKWLTPPISTGILNGVMRAIVLEAKLATVAPITISDMNRATKGVLISSLRVAQEITEIAGHKLASSASMCSEIGKLNEGFRGF